MSENVSNENINELNVSASWLAKFDILNNIGAGEKSIYKALNNAKFKALPFRERQKIIFNVWAFLFGPLYYFSKKMWHKGAFLIGAAFLLSGLFSLIEMSMGMKIPDMIYWVIPSVICSQLANYDYFRLKTKGEKIWSGLPEILATPIGAIGFPITCFLLALTALMAFADESVPACSSDKATNLVVKISNEELARQVGAQVAKNISISVSAIRTTKTNDQTGAYTCAAQLDIARPDGNRALPITYTVEKTDEGNQFYVNVFGLK